MVGSVLKVSLSNKDYSYTKFPASTKFIGGAALSDYMLLQWLNLQTESDSSFENYISITTGPLSGLFPFTSKSIVKHYTHGAVKDSVAGGKFGSLMNISGLLCLEISGKIDSPTILDIKDKSVNFLPYSKGLLNTLGYAGRRSVLTFDDDILNDGYFNYGSGYNKSNNLVAVMFSASQNYNIRDLVYYKEVYKEILSKIDQLQVSKGTNPSCFGCPVGCAFSDRVENINTSVLSKSLVSCAYAEPIYSDINTVFKCLQSVGLSHNHEDLEHFSLLAGETKKQISLRLKNVSNS